MPTDLPPNLILIGFSGSGKSSVGRLLADRLCWRFVDLDETIAARAGKSVPAIFAEEGEARFRALEAAALREACAGEHTVIATGGGAVVDPANRALLLARGFVVCLEAQPRTLHARLSRHQQEDEEGARRPLLAGEDPLARITALKERRQAFYAACHATIHTDDLNEEEAAAEVHRALARAGLAFAPGDGTGPVSIKTADGYYHVHVGGGLLAKVGELAARRHPQARFFLVADENVFARYGEPALASLRRDARAVHHLVVPAGEASKSLAMAGHLYDWLIRERAERGDVLVALGGGVVGDLVGFVAATYLRGIDFVQVPTSLLAMVDSSVGGKTAVDHPLGKNLIGAFHPPSLVVADVETLRTLPPRELRSGWAEVVKHAMIMDPALFAQLETAAPTLAAADEGAEPSGAASTPFAAAPAEVLAAIVRRNVWLKARVVTADERERGGRIALNYGHTVGHAVEAAANYALSHGEAVAVGMAAAARLAVAIGWLSPVEAARQDELLRAFGLRTALPVGLGLRPQTVQEIMQRDKKAQGQALRWVLPTRIGAVKVARNLPDELVRQTLEGVLE